jgi:hypothetical protein
MTNPEPRILMLLDNPFISDLRVNKEALSLVKVGFHVTIVCTKQNELAEEENIDGIEIKRWIGSFYMHPLRRSFRTDFEQFLKKLFTLDFSILHCHDYMMLNLGGRIKGQKPCIFLIYDSHEYFRGWKYYEEIPSSWNRIKGYLVWKYLIRKEKAYLRKSNAIITTTRLISEKLKRDTGIKINPIALQNIPTIKKAKCSKAETNLKSYFNIKNDEICMVQSGNIYQSIELFMQMFEAVSEIKKLHLVIINNRPIADELAALVIKSEHLSNVIHFIKYDSKILANQLESADFGMLFMRTNIWSSHYLTSPNRIMEYSLCGLPFISIPQAMAEDLDIKYNHVEFYDCEDISSFKSAINRIIETLPEKKKNAERIKYSLSWDAEFAPVIELYKKVAARLSA